MTNPPPGPMRLKIAEILGWTEIVKDNRNGLWFGFPPPEHVDQRKSLIPNWLGSLDAARELPITIWGNFVNSLDRIMGNPKAATEMLKATSEQWCYAWIRYKGWRWVECEECARPLDPDELPPIELKPHFACNSEGGEFVHDST